LGAAGDTVYYQCLADTLDTDLGRALGNVLALRRLDPPILLSDKSSEGISLQILYKHVTVWNPNLIDLNSTEQFIIRGVGALNGDVWPQSDEASAVVAFLLGGDDELSSWNWDEISIAAITQLRALMLALRGGASSLLENNHRKCGRVTSAGNSSTFTGKFEDTAEIPNYDPAVEMDANKSMQYDDAMMQRVSQGTVDPQILWLWSARQALEASVVGTQLALRIEEFATMRETGSLADHIVTVMTKVVTITQTSLHAGVNADAGDMQIIPANRYVDDDVGTTAAQFVSILASELNVQPPDNEFDARARVMHEMATGKVVCAFFCESDDAIRPPCRDNGEYTLQAACTQIREAREHPTPAESAALIAQWRAGPSRDEAYHELAAEQHNVFAPVIVGANPENWHDRIVRWAESIVQPPQEPEPRAVPETGQRFPVLHTPDVQMHGNQYPEGSAAENEAEIKRTHRAAAERAAKEAAAINKKKKRLG
jgi:hypothetical protein